MLRAGAAPVRRLPV